MNSQQLLELFQQNAEELDNTLVSILGHNIELVELGAEECSIMDSHEHSNSFARRLAIATLSIVDDDGERMYKIVGYGETRSALGRLPKSVIDELLAEAEELSREDEIVDLDNGLQSVG